MTAPAAGPKPSIPANWKEAAEKFRNANGYGHSYTIDFNASIDALICDPDASPFVRILAWMKRGAWGNFSPFVTDKIGGTHPRTWADCARDTGLSKQRVSEVSAFYLAHGYARWEKGIIYPEPSPAPILEAELSGSSDSPSLNFRHDTNGYKTFLAQWLADHPAEAAAAEEARTVLRALRLRVLVDYRAAVEAKKHAGAADTGSPDAADTTPGLSTDAPEDLAPTPRTREGDNVSEIKESVARLTVNRESAASLSSVTATTTTTEVPSSPTPEEGRVAVPLSDAEEVAAALWRQDVPADDSLVATIIDGARAVEPTATGIACLTLAKNGQSEAHEMVHILLQHGFAADAPGAELLIQRCRKNDARVLISEICAMIEMKAPLARGKKNPLGFVIVAVPNCFVGGDQSFIAAYRRHLADSARAGSPQSARSAAVPICERCGGSGFPGECCDSLNDAHRLMEAGVRLCACEDGALWLRLLEPSKECEVRHGTGTFT